MWKFEPVLNLEQILQFSVGQTTRLTGAPEPDLGTWSMERLMSFLASFSDITGIGVMELLLLHVVANGRARRRHLMEVFRSYWCEDGYLIGSSYVLKDYDRQNLEEDSRRAFDALFRHGLINEGMEGLIPWRAEEGVIDQWNDASYEVHEDSIELSNRGREICEHVESALFELSQVTCQLVGDVLCFVGEHPPLMSACFHFYYDCGLRPGECGQRRPSCSARLLLRWRPAWWRRPRVGYLVLCRNEQDIEIRRSETGKR